MLFSHIHTCRSNKTEYYILSINNKLFNNWHSMFILLHSQGTIFKNFYCRSRYDDDNEWGCTNWCEYVVVVVLAALLLIASLTLTLFWIMYYREGFSWDTNPTLQFNLHPVLMVAGFITFSGFCKFQPTKPFVLCAIKHTEP